MTYPSRINFTAGTHGLPFLFLYGYVRISRNIFGTQNNQFNLVTSLFDDTNGIIHIPGRFTIDGQYLQKKINEIETFQFMTKRNFLWFLSW